MYDNIPTGPTGQYPEGKLTGDDQGELQIAIGHKKGVVWIELGTPTKWLACPPALARQLAAHLFNHAHAVDGKGPLLEIHGD